ncbi:catecholate siderophore receptor Fiu [Asticcacaulis solisilvae]|uniref:catecholate siderophore receptor Fiu n=1 Tax=Asticcacaulis solisilvae TaxID=1217274 RepID=UPI003FD7F299
MPLIRSRKHNPGRYLAALTLAGMAVTAAAQAESATENGDHDNPVTVTGHHERYKSDTVSSPKKTEALVDTPQTVSVISKELLSDQNAVTLTDALRNTPGITMQLGENGSTSAGDTFQLRGFSAQSSIYLDGIRDLGAVSRDVFNVEQVEVAKGPAGAEGGRGSSAGYINLVSKRPYLETRNHATVSGYSDGGLRASVDSNVRLGKTSGFRLNIMDQDVDVPGRDYVKNSGYGVAPAYGLGIGTDTRFYLLGQVVQQKNLPDGGLPVVGLAGYHSNATQPTPAVISNAQLALNNAALSAAAPVDSRNFYGSPNDYEKVDAAMATSIIEHDFADGVHLVNTTRYGQTSMDRVLTGVNGTNAAAASFNPADPSTWAVTRSRQRVDQDNRILASATNLTASLDWGSWTHDVSAGLELTYEEQQTKTYGTTGLVIPAASLYHPNVNDTLPVPVATGAATDGDTTTVAGYVFDTAKHGPWLLSAGLRLDTYTIHTNNTAATGATAIAPLKDSRTIASWNIGAVYKPRRNGSVYISYATSLTPPGGSNFQLSSTAGNLANAALDPTETDNFEIGTKWDVFRDHLSLTAAWYNTQAKNEISLQDPVTLLYAQIGKREVSGIELGAVGQLSPKWTVSAGVQTMHTEIKQGSTGNNAQGAATRWSPDLTATVWTTYKVTKRLTVGGGASYTSDQLLVVNPETDLSTYNGLPKIPSFVVANAMASYDLTRRIELQLNVYNLFDENYIQSLNNGGSRVTKGQPRTATLTAHLRF